jgi:hypothetical protein
MSSRTITTRVAIAGALLALLCLQCFVVPLSTHAQTYPTLTGALDGIGAKYKAHLGLEYAFDDTDGTPLTLDLSAATIEPVLDQLIAQQPQYAWCLKGGVYDIYPRSNPDSVLDVVVSRFSINDANPAEASTAISELPEVKEWLANRGVVRRELEASGPKQEPKLRISVALTDVTLRRILDRLILQPGRVYWVVMRYGDDQEFLGIYFW